MRSGRTDAWGIDTVLDDVVEIACEGLRSKRGAFRACDTLGKLQHVNFASKRDGEHQQSYHVPCNP